MKIVMKPIDMVLSSTNEGIVTPIRFKVENNDGSGSTVLDIKNIIRLGEKKEEKKRVRYFRGVIEHNGKSHQIEFKFDMETCRWYLYRM